MNRKIGRLLLGLLLLPALANAQGLFDPVPGSKAMVLLASLFGNLGIFGSSGADPFVAAIGTFLGGILMVGGILVAYTVLAGTLGTAHDGEMLGKKFSSIWIPIRTAMGTALVLPVIGGGYCLMQLMVGWVIVQGVGLADKTWGAFVSASNITTVASAGLQRPEAKTLGANLFQSLVCVEALKVAVSSTSGQVLAPGAVIGQSVDDGITSRTIRFGRTGGGGAIAVDECGKVEVAKFQAPATGTASGNIIGGIMDGQAAAARMSGIAAEHQVQVQNLISALQPLAQQLVATKQPINPASIDAAVTSYEEAVRAKAAAEIAAMDPFKEVSQNSAQDGFLMAGAFMMKISYFTDLVNRSMSNVPTSSGAKTKGTGAFGDQFAEVFPAMSQTLVNTRGGVANFGVGNEQGGSNTGWWDAVKDSIAGGLDPVPLMKKAFTSSTNFAIQDGEHPLMAMKRMGNWLLGIGGTAWAASIGLMATAGNAPGIGMALMMTAAMTLPVMLVLGFTLSYMLPMMPFLIWLGAVVGWLILCVEAIFAAPVWAVMHLHPNGDDVAGKGANGYNLVLSLMLRPVLMVFGFIASIVLLNVFGQFVNRIFADVFLVSQQDSGFFVWLGAFLAGPLIYCIVMFTVIKKLFTVIYMIPDQLLNWFSGGGAQLGRSAEAVGGTSTYIAANAGLQQGMAKGETVGQMMKQNHQLKETHLANQAERADNREKGFADMDKDIGQGTANLAKIAEAQAGGSESQQGSYAAQKAATQIKDAVSQLGGKESVGGTAFMSKLNESMQAKPTGTVEEHFNSAMNKGLNEAYGSGAGKMAAMIGKGYEGPEFNRAVATLKDASERMKAQGMDSEDIKDNLSKVFNDTFANYANDPKSSRNGGERSPQAYLADNLSKMIRPKPQSAQDTEE